MMIPDTTGQSTIQQTDALLDELRTLIGDLGKDGGIISPSVYDTAQVLRFYPPEEGVEPALEWLLSQQQADGGWGDPVFPMARDVPTMAAILSLATHLDGWQNSHAISQGIRFLSRQARLWDGPLPDDIPVAAELIIPKLLQDAEKMQVPIPERAYGSICELGKRRRQLISSMQPGAGTTAAYSWETWGVDPETAVFDERGSVGHSPSATAAWLARALHVEDLDSECSAAKEYLRRASLSTRSGIPGLYPTAWPINRFEQAFGLYALLVTGLLDHPKLVSVVRGQLESVQSAMLPNGIGFTDHFEPDGDNTAAAVAVLGASGYSGYVDALESFRRERYFSSYPFELQPSLSVTARAIHGYEQNGVSSEAWTPIIAGHQNDEGYWAGDKWNVSWIYTTAHMMTAYGSAHRCDVSERAKRALIASQHYDGGWGSGSKSSQFETAMALIGLNDSTPCQSSDEIALARMRACSWLDLVIGGDGYEDEKYWLNKELFSVQRIDRSFILSARLMLTDLAHWVGVDSSQTVVYVGGA